MKKMTKATVFILIFAILSVLVMCIVLSDTFSYSDGKRKMKIQDKYHFNQDEISLISKSLLRKDCARIVIWLNSEDTQNIKLHLMDTLPVEEEIISDTELSKAVSTVFGNGCDVIEKDKNCVFFQFQSTMDDGFGILYLDDNTCLPDFDSSGYQLTTEQIEGNIYYYKSTLNHSR